MIIEHVELRHIALPLQTPWRTAYGSDPTIHSVVVRIVSEGLEGWGEATPFLAPTYSPEIAHCAFYVMKEFFVPMIIGREVGSSDELLSRLACFKGHSFAKAALETAWWNLESALRGIPLWKMLGGTKEVVQVGADFQIYEETGQLLSDIAKAVEAGYPRVKLKIAPGYDLAVVKAVRKAFPGLTMHVDCNSAYDFAKDRRLFQGLDEFDLAMIEQPLQNDDLVDHARLQSMIDTPICLDESVTSVRNFALALRLGSCRAVNIKPGRVGGLGPSVDIHDMAREAKLIAWVGGMLESGIGVRVAAALATLPGFSYPGDIFPSDRIHKFDIVTPRVELDSSCQINVQKLLEEPMELLEDNLGNSTLEVYRE